MKNFIVPVASTGGQCRTLFRCRSCETKNVPVLRGLRRLLPV